jgi:hypothetical protein
VGLDLVALGGEDGAEVWPVRVAGEPKGISTGQPLRVEGLTAQTWEVDGRHGVASACAGWKPRARRPSARRRREAVALVNGSERVLGADVRALADVLARAVRARRELADAMNAAQRRPLCTNVEMRGVSGSERPIRCVALCRTRSGRGVDRQPATSVGRHAPELGLTQTSLS